MLAQVGEVIASGSMLLAVPIALAAGLVSFFSPCVLPLVPGFLSYVTGLAGAGLTQAHVPGPALVGAGTSATGSRPEPLAGSPRPPMVARPRLVLGTLAFVSGFSIVFISYGALFGGLGAQLLAHQELVTRGLGILVIVVGLGFLGAIPALQRDLRWHHRPGRGLAGALLLGGLFGLGWTPCIGPTLATVQALAMSEASAVRGALLSLAYCLGLGLPFVGIAAAMERGLPSLDWARRHSQAISRVGGFGMIVIGVLMVTGLWGSLTIALRGLISAWSVPL